MAVKNKSPSVANLLISKSDRASEKKKRSQLKQSRSYMDTGRNAACTKTNSCNDVWICEDSSGWKSSDDHIVSPINMHS